MQQDQSHQDPTNSSPFGDPTSGPGGFPLPGQDPATDAKPEDTTPAHFQLGVLFPEKFNINVPAHTLKFDEQRFLHLLAGSISLSRDEKKKIIETIPKLKQSQIDELIRIFEEEKEKFSQLSAKHVPQLEKLTKQHYQDWQDLEVGFKAEVKAADDNAQADEIRKSLGL